MNRFKREIIDPYHYQRSLIECECGCITDEYNLVCPIHDMFAKKIHPGPPLNLEQAVEVLNDRHHARSCHDKPWVIYNLGLAGKLVAMETFAGIDTLSEFEAIAVATAYLERERDERNKY